MQGQVKVEGRNFADSSRKGATVGDVVWRTCCSGRKGQKVVVRYSRCLWASFYKSDNKKKKGNKLYKGGENMRLEEYFEKTPSKKTKDKPQKMNMEKEERFIDPSP